MMRTPITKALYFMDGFRRCGATKFLREDIENTAHLFEDPSSKVELDKYRAVLEKMENFESIYGVGSCLNIDNEAFYEIAVVRKLYRPMIEVTNALNAPASLRAQAITMDDGREPADELKAAKGRRTSLLGPRQATNR
ncbi:hypothetical protein IR196_05755 [Brucella anthropi]|uniref:hypothetical protein n=1 Tax=Brucella anthropi TaxID=529 RepID=UPI00188D6037|nr:hypothetical protein [Brucella anthropi]QPA25599.1 hypothetical protein IR196_05755 [Brucella anthropi]